MSLSSDPALEALVAKIGNELIVAQVMIRRTAAGFELRHVDDCEQSSDTLRVLSLNDVRSLAQFTTQGAFRPLKSAPNLQKGWRLRPSGNAELETALNQLYPGLIADWFAARSPRPPITHYREFTNRQTGMYRVTQMLNDDQAAQVISAGCHNRLCLKQRLWTVEGLAPDAQKDKSLIPCLEPCALLLEFARKAMRIEQEEKVKIEVAPDELAVLKSSLQSSLKEAARDVREGDFNSPRNPRRIQLVLAKLDPLMNLSTTNEQE
ncbi:MAG: DR2241 family protein [Verrucomicrobiota bacterium]